MSENKQTPVLFVLWTIPMLFITLFASTPLVLAGETSDVEKASKMHFIAQLHGTREGWPEYMTEHEEKVMTDHYYWLVNLMHDGKMLLAGPAPGQYGLVILEVADENEARTLMDQEPSVDAGVHTYSLHPFVASLLYGRDRLPQEESDLRVEKEATVNGSLDDVWHCWTTSEGVRSFLVEKAIIELKVGGKYEMHFSNDAPRGLRGSEGCRVLTYLPKRLLSFSWNAPPQFERERFMRTRVVVEFELINDTQTRVRLVHLGFGVDGQWKEVHEYFENAWGYVMAALTKRFDK